MGPRGLQLTEAMLGALRMLEDCYEADHAVKAEGRTAARLDEDYGTLNARVARRLVAEGLARYSHPSGTYILLTDTGRAIARVRRAS